MIPALPKRYGSSEPHLIRRTLRLHEGLSFSMSVIAALVEPRSTYSGIISHLDLATTYDVDCQAGSRVLTVNCFSGYDLRVRPTKVTASPLSQTDVIRSRGFGAKW